MDDRVLLLIPAFNEAATLGLVLTEARDTQVHCSAESKFEILVVDDGSFDDTSRIARAYGCRLIRHQKNTGYGAALRSGFSFAHEERYDYVVTLDGDGQHRPQDVPRLLRKRGRGQLVSASRYLPASVRLSQPPAPKINRLFAELVNLLTGFDISDVGCGLKCIDVHSLERMHLDENGYLFPLEFWWACHAAEVAVREVAVPMIYCDAGRNIRARYGSVELALDQAVFFLLRLTLDLRIKYSPTWGVEVRRAICDRELPRGVELVVWQLLSTEWSELPLDSVRANLGHLNSSQRQRVNHPELLDCRLWSASC